MRLGRYELLAKIAEGGMASVYLGRLSGPMGFQRPVAIKLMRPEYVQSEDFVKMFLDEARLVARLSHPNIVQLLELGQDEGPIGRMHGGFFIVMECLMGESLLDTWYACQERRLMMPYDLVAWIGARAAEGLHHAHELKDPATGASERIVHRDVNPGNIFLTYDGQVKVIDFGVAKALNRLSGATSVGQLKGKVAYMAPEQAKTGDVDRRADVFSLAVTLWELSTDRRLFKRRSDVDTLIAVTEAEVPDPTAAIPDYPRELWGVLARSLRANRDERYASALDLSRELDRVAQCLGRTCDASVLGEMMNYLFAAQRHRYVEWLKQATAGESSEVLRSNDPRRVEVAGVDAMPLSARSGQAMPIGPAPQPPPPEASYDHPTVALSTAAMLAHAPAAMQSAAHAPPMPQPGMMPAPMPMQPMPTQQPMHMPMQVAMPMQQPMQMPMQPMPMTPSPAMYPYPSPPVQQGPVKSTGNVSNVVFMLIAGLAVLSVAGYFVYVRFVAHPAPPPPAPSVTHSAPTPPPTATPTLETSAAPSASAPRPETQADAESEASAAASAPVAPPPTSPPRPRTPEDDDPLKSRH